MLLSATCDIPSTTTHAFFAILAAFEASSYLDVA